MYQDYVNSRALFTTDHNVLHAIGALKTGGLYHPDIFNLVNNIHKDYIHIMWKHIV